LKHRGNHACHRQSFG